MVNLGGTYVRSTYAVGLDDWNATSYNIICCAGTTLWSDDVDPARRQADAPVPALNHPVEPDHRIEA